MTPTYSYNLPVGDLQRCCSSHRPSSPLAFARIMSMRLRPTSATAAGQSGSVPRVVQTGVIDINAFFISCMSLCFCLSGVWYAAVLRTARSASHLQRGW